MVRRGALSESVDLGEEVFNLLKRRGPLCASQIAVEIGISLKNLELVLDQLHAEGAIEPRPDHDRSLLSDKSEEPWGLPRPSLFRRKAR
jgi:predicted ArsR family transcriptional regulator